MTRLLLLGVLLALALPAVAQAETVTVTSTADTNDGTCNAHCTLREALILSSTEATIVVPAGTYTAETSSFGLNGNRAIVGAGAGATRLSGPGRRVLLVGPGTSSVTGVRISDGNSLSTGAGAGIHVGSGANFTLRDSLVDHNTAMLGGGIYSEGTLTVERSLIQANDAAATPASASRGGGLAVNGGTATITNTTFSDNSSDAFGGGIHVQAGSATLESVTVADNTATEGSAINQEGAGAVTAANTLVSGTAGNGCRLTPAGIAWSRGIVDGADASCGSGALVLDDAGVSVLDDNGGPTQTHALVPGSAAVDAGTGCPAEDQRGVARPQAATCDIGAYELVPVPVTVTTTADGDDGNCDSHCTLREALADPEAHLVHLPLGVYVLSPGLGELQVSRSVAIQGTGTSLSTIRPNPEFRHRVIRVLGGATLRLGHVRIAGGRADGDNGGGILVDSDSALDVFESEIAGNEAAAGGGIWADGDLLLRSSSVVANLGVAGGEGLGGGIGLGSGVTVASLVNTTLSGNESDGWGGGLFTRRSVTLQNVSIVDNTAPPRGVNEPTGRGGGLSQDFANQPDAVTTARNVLVARNAGGGCGGTVNDLIDSDNGLVDEPLPATTCNAVGDANLIVPDAVVDGLGDNGGPTLTHALLAGSPAIDSGDGCPADDQRGRPRPQGTACDIGAVEFEPPQQQPPQGGGGTTQPPPDDDPGLPLPTAGEEVNAEVARGTVRVKLPGSNRFVELDEPQQLPVGTVVDTTKGRITLIAAGGQTATFYDGIFRIGQGKGARPLTTLTLVEKLSCPKAGSAIAAAKKKKRRLWGDGSGRFRTKGKHSAATVVGTKWLVEDRCKSTLTRVTRGRVTVRDFVKKKTVTVRAGKKYVARARR